MANKEPNEATRFLPGQSGNPGGKNPEREALRLAVQDYLAGISLENVKAIETLAKKAESQKVQLAARIWLGEQFLGKATQKIAGPDGGPVQLDMSRLSADEINVLDELRRKVTGG